MYQFITSGFHRLVGDVLVCTAFLSYSGPFNQDFRLLLNQKWFKELKNRKIPCTLNLSVIDMLTDPTVVSVDKKNFTWCICVYNQYSVITKVDF